MNVTTFSYVYKEIYGMTTVIINSLYTIPKGK